jgi:hypothetical protein
VIEPEVTVIVQDMGGALAVKTVQLEGHEVPVRKASLHLPADGPVYVTLQVLVSKIEVLTEPILR